MKGFTCFFACSLSLFLLTGNSVWAQNAIVPVTLANTLPANDDGSTDAVSLGIDVANGINFFGMNFSQVYVNNNGNLTFGEPLSEYTPDGLAEGVGLPIIAPFFADVDTTGDGSGLVMYGNATITCGNLGISCANATYNTFVANYINVGYYSEGTDKLDSFQAILVDRSDTGAGNFDLEFNYGNILWETGDASGGTDGLGGTSAVAGYSNGNSDNNQYFQINGSLVNGALINGGPDALISHSLNSTVPGRYIFQVRGGFISLSVATPSLPVGVVGVPYGPVTLAASGGAQPYSWSATGLPPGMSINSTTGVLNGTPTPSGIYSNAVITVNDSAENTANQTYSIAIEGPVTNNLVLWLEGNAGLTHYEGGAIPGWTDQSGNENNATSLAEEDPGYVASAINGLPAAQFAGGQAMMIPGNLLSSQNLTILAVVSDTGAGTPGLRDVFSNWDTTTTTNSIFMGIVGQSSAGSDKGRFTDYLGGADDDGDQGAGTVPNPTVPFLLSGAINTGAGYLYYDSTQLATNTVPERDETHPFYIGQQGNSGAEAWNGYIAEILVYNSALNPSDYATVTNYLNTKYAIVPQSVPAPPAPPTPTAPPLQISGSSSLGDILLGRSISGGFSASGGVPPYSFSSSGTPSGIAFSSGSFSGTPQAPGSYSFTVFVTDSVGHEVYTSVSYAVFGFSGGSLPPAIGYALYSAGVSAAGGYQPYSYTMTGAPPGLSISTTGAISGTPTRTGSFSLSITATDGGGLQATATYSLTVNAPPPLQVTGGALTSVVIQTPTSQTLSATGGAPPYTWSLVAGALPSGLSLQSSGTIGGTPSAAGSFSFTARATDSTGASAPGSFTMTILPPPVTILSPSPLAGGMVSVGYPVQTLSAKGGVAPYIFTVSSGSLPAGLSLSSTGAITGTPTGPATLSTSFTVMASDSSTPAATGTATLSIAIRAFAPALILSSGSASFALAAGSTSLPGGQAVQVQSTDVTQVLGYSVAVAPASATWLSVSGAGGSTPGSFSIALSGAALSLAAATAPYQASVVVTCTVSVCAGTTQTVNVSLSVTALPPQLTLSADSLSFSTITSAEQTTSQTLGVSNSGGGNIGIASVTCGAPWCTVSGVPGTLGAAASASIAVTANPNGLSAGYYWTDLSIVSSAGSAIVPVTYLIAANGTLTLAPAGEQFNLPQGGQATGETSFLVAISGSAPAAFTAQVLAGAPWLSVTPTSGSVSGTQPATVNLVFNQTQVAALAVGTYYATVQISSTGAVNSPQSFEVVLNVTAATQPTTPNPVPGGLIFLTNAVSTPPAQTVTVYSSSPAGIGYQASASTSKGGNWLSVSPSTGSTSAAGAAQSSITVNPANLTPGVYTGTVSYAFSAIAVRSVNITLVVESLLAPAAGSTQISAKGAEPEQTSGGCSSTQIVPTSTALVSNFAAPAAWPIELAVQLFDNCGNAISNGQVVATFSNGDPPLILALANSNTGLYDGTWTPRQTAAQIVINARASAPGLPTATTQLAGAVTPNNAPVLAHNSTANFYNPVGGAPLAPGTLVEITGQYLAAQSLTDSTIPVPATLGGTSVIIGGIPAPVTFVSPGQIDAQVPFELPAGQPYQVIVNANGALATPDSIQSGAASPGLSVLANGYVRANHQNGTQVSDSSPAKPGEYIAVYLVGLGPTDIPVASGQPGPSSPLANTTNAPSITLNGEAASYIFSGLAPGEVGVYQVNLQVPTNAVNGDLVLTFSQTGISSNSGILPVHN